MTLSFVRFWPVIFLLLIPWLWWVKRRSTAPLAPPLLRLSSVIRTSVVGLAVAALLEPSLLRTSQDISVAFVLDVSRSIAPTFIEASLQWIEDAVREGRPAHAVYIAFADHPETVEEPAGIRTLPVSQTGREPPGEGAGFDEGVLYRGDTDIELALSQAVRLLPPHTLKRVVLMTDGHSSRGDVKHALWQARRTGARVFTRPAEVRNAGDVWIDSLVLPDEVHAGEPVDVRVRLFSGLAETAVLELRIAGEPAGRAELALEPGPNETSLTVRPSAEGALPLEARVSTRGDTFSENDREHAMTWVGAPIAVLYIEGHPPSARYLHRALTEERLRVTVGGPEGLPPSVDELIAYDLVFLSDVPAAELTPDQMQALEAYVRDEGGGMIFAGGESSFGESGYASTPVETLLPLWFRVEEQHKDLALVITLDKSYSMVGEKIELAREATKAALEVLEETHRFGVVTFNWDPFVTVPLQVVGGRQQAIRKEIDGITASAQTNIYPALRVSYDQLVKAPSQVKHIILLSDGKTYPDDYEALVTSMAEDEITVSTVAVGAEADRELLSRIAEWGNGRSYLIDDPVRVPQIFIRETQMAARATLSEERFRPIVKHRIEALHGVDLSSAPSLRGYVRTKAKEGAEVILEAEEESPLLARWQYGLGKAVAFTSDVKNRWAVDWLGWGGYGKLWAQLVRETARRHHKEEISFRVEREGDEAKISLSLIDAEGRYRSGMQPEVHVSRPGAPSITLALRPKAPGHYEARYPVAVTGETPYRFRLATEDGPEQTRLLYYTYPDEYRFRPADIVLLQTLAEATGGSLDPEAAEIFDPRGETVTDPTPLWGHLAGLALALYLADVVLRRAGWVFQQREQREQRQRRRETA